LSRSFPSSTAVATVSRYPKTKSPGESVSRAYNFCVEVLISPPNDSRDTEEREIICRRRRTTIRRRWCGGSKRSTVHLLSFVPSICAWGLDSRIRAVSLWKKEPTVVSSCQIFPPIIAVFLFMTQTSFEWGWKTENLSVSYVWNLLCR
jgi:hypothetical protein